MPLARIALAMMLLIPAGCATLPAQPSTATETESTREVVKRYWSAANAGDSAAAASLFADDAVYRDKTFDFAIRGAPAIRAMLDNALAMLRPVERTIVHEIYDGPNAAVEWEARGTHAGAILGVPPTGRKITIRAVSLIMVRNGKIASVTDYTDRTGLEAQLKQWSSVRCNRPGCVFRQAQSNSKPRTRPERPGPSSG